MATGSIRLSDLRTGIKLVSVLGEHDLYTAPRLREQLESLLGGGEAVVVDLTGATFVDSSILGALLSARQRAIDDQSGFAVCLSQETEPAVRRIFEMTGLMDTLPVRETTELAAQTAAGAPADGDEGPSST